MKLQAGSVVVERQKDVSAAVIAGEQRCQYVQDTRIFNFHGWKLI